MTIALPGEPATDYNNCIGSLNSSEKPVFANSNYAYLHQLCTGCIEYVWFNGRR